MIQAAHRSCFCIQGPFAPVKATFGISALLLDTLVDALMPRNLPERRVIPRPLCSYMDFIPHHRLSNLLLKTFFWR